MNPNLSKDSNPTRYLSFSVGTEAFAVPLLSVKEVIAIPEITPVPHAPPHFLGIMNLRGQVISLVDLRLRLNIPAKRTDETAVIICELSPYCIGVVVDSIDAVLAPAAEEISPVPETGSRVSTEHLTGVFKNDQDLILILAIAKILGVEDLSIAGRAAA